MNTTPDILEKTFRATYLEEINALKETDTFAYYTSATTALQILQNKEIWMRAASCMNDYKEIDYGIELFKKSFSDKKRKDDFDKVLGLMWDEKTTTENILLEFATNNIHLKNATFITCISKQENAIENTLGRLSMWRAYGSDSGIAFIFKAYNLLSSELSQSLSPIEYFTQDVFNQKIDTIISNVSSNYESLLKIDKDTRKKHFRDTIFFALTSIKHPGFKEEQEWRIIYPHKLLPDKFNSKNVTINNIPQIIYKLPFNLFLPDIFDHIIIGPTIYADSIASSFEIELGNLGINNPETKIIKSNIPLRK